MKKFKINKQAEKQLKRKSIEIQLDKVVKQIDKVDDKIQILYEKSDKLRRQKIELVDKLYRLGNDV